MTGNSAGSGTGDDYATVAYDASTGAELWSARYNGPADGYETSYALGVSPDGSRVFVTGDSYGPTPGPDYATVANDASIGTELWVARYNGPANSADSAAALGVSPDGSRVFVTGVSLGETSYHDVATVAYEVG